MGAWWRARSYYLLASRERSAITPAPTGATCFAGWTGERRARKCSTVARAWSPFRTHVVPFASTGRVNVWRRKARTTLPLTPRSVASVSGRTASSESYLARIAFASIRTPLVAWDSHARTAGPSTTEPMFTYALTYVRTHAHARIFPIGPIRKFSLCIVQSVLLYAVIVCISTHTNARSLSVETTYVVEHDNEHVFA